MVHDRISTFLLHPVSDNYGPILTVLCAEKMPRIRESSGSGLYIGTGKKTTKIELKAESFIVVKW